MKTEEKIEVNVDLTSEPVCQVVWWDEKSDSMTECINKAEWVALAHEEGWEHTNGQILICDECKIVAEYKKSCKECGQPIISNIRRL